MSTNSKLAQALKGNTNAAKNHVKKTGAASSTPKVGGTFASKNAALRRDSKDAFGTFTKGTKTNSMETPQAYEKRQIANRAVAEKKTAAMDKKYANVRVSKSTKAAVKNDVARMVISSNKSFNEKNSQYSRGRRDAPARLKAVNAADRANVLAKINGREKPPKAAPVPKKS